MLLAEELAYARELLIINAIPIILSAKSAQVGLGVRPPELTRGCAAISGVNNLLKQETRLSRTAEGRIDFRHVGLPSPAERLIQRHQI
jgi:hypothetical protein